MIANAKAAPQKEVRKKQGTLKSSPHFKCLSKAAHIAEYYGFASLPDLHINRRDVSVSKAFKESPETVSPVASLINVEELTTILNAYAEKKLQSFSQPPMLYYEGRLPHDGERLGSPERHLILDVVGSSKSVVEAILIQTAYTILQEEHGKDFVVEINSVGDRESIAKFTREATNYFKKILPDLPAPLKAAFKKDPLSLYTFDHPKAKEIIAEAPQSISYLSESSRTLFKEVLEYLETMDISYQINPMLLGNKNFCSETVFYIRQANATSFEDPHAIGIRYNSLSKKIGLKKEVPSARVVIHLPKMKMEPLKKGAPKQPKAKFYFIQIGFEAKIKSLKVVEMLRKEKVPLSYSLIKDKLTGQLLTAEQLDTPYILLMGQKESMENTVLVRNMKNSSQETIAIADLIKYLKKLK